MTRRFVLGALLVIPLGCGAETGLRVDEPIRFDAGSRDAAVVRPDAANRDTGVLHDAGDDGRTDAGVDAARMPICRDREVTALINVTTDDQFVLWLNGTMIAAPPAVWDMPHTYTVSLVVSSSNRNAIVIQGTNLDNTDGLDRGIIMDMHAVGGPGRLHTDSIWRMSTSAAPGFFDVAFDDSSWPFAVEEGANGVAPWGPLLGPSTAQWLWSYVSSGDRSSKPVMETVVVRRDFYVWNDLTIHDTPEPCP